MTIAGVTISKSMIVSGIVGAILFVLIDRTLRRALDNDPWEWT